MIKEPFTPIRFFEAIVPNYEECRTEYHKIVEKLKAEGVMTKEVNGPTGDDDKLITDYFVLEDDKQENAMKLWHPFCMKYLHSTIIDFMNDLDIKDLAFEALWSQISKGLQFHHPHDHGDIGWSFVWYIDVDPNEHKSTVWYAPPPADRDDNSIYQTELVPNKIVIWPSHLMHYQPPSNSSIDRCIISGNISEQGEIN